MKHNDQKMWGAEKTLNISHDSADILPKPAWIRGKRSISQDVECLTNVMRENNLHTVCEEAACPNIGECFRHGTASFMIMGAICTRRCAFCNVTHGHPIPLDNDEPQNLGHVILSMGLRYVVITSVNRDDLPDGGANHFTHCIQAIRGLCDGVKIEILVPDFRGKIEVALKAINEGLPDVFNHNIETVPRLYGRVRPGADYFGSLGLINFFKERHDDILTKSGLMLGLGESIDEVCDTMKDLRDHGCDMLTLGQYLRPSLNHLPVERYVTPREFNQLREIGLGLGFSHVASGPMVRSSYHADLQVQGMGAKTAQK
jgi:lipoic acid synthetase